MVVTLIIADRIEQAIPAGRQPQGWQQRTKHDSNPIHHPFDASECKMFNVRSRKLDAHGNAGTNPGIPLTFRRMNSESEHSPLTRFAWLSIAAAVVTIGLKLVAYRLTGSVGLLSDAIESGVNLVGGIMALAMLTVAARPADEDHPYGHGKAEYFSSGVEGTLILVAAVSIAYAAAVRLITPRPLEQIGLGLVVSVLASLVNLGVALLLRQVGRKRNSITLEANAQHLLTDVWTSVGVLLGVGAVALTGWQRLDPLVALLVAANIVWTGVGIVRRSTAGLMDAALSPEDQAVVRKALQIHEPDGVRFEALQTRQSGAYKFVSLHVLVPGEWTTRRSHQLLDRVESDIRRALPGASVITHLESLDEQPTPPAAAAPDDPQGR
jgi:cation diffusion facilitator family transporter